MSNNPEEIIGVSKEQGWHFTMLENAVIDDFTLHKDAKGTYMAICRFANIDSRTCYPSIASIARKAGISVRQVRNMLPILVKRGYLRMYHRKSDSGDNTSNHYSISWNPELNIDLDCIDFSQKNLSKLGVCDLWEIAKKLDITDIPDSKKDLINLLIETYSELVHDMQHQNKVENEVVHSVHPLHNAEKSVDNSEVVHGVQEGGAWCASPGVHGVHPNNRHIINYNQSNEKLNNNNKNNKKKQPEIPISIWEEVLGVIETKISQPAFDTWLKPTKLSRIDKTNLVISVPNEFCQEWIESRYKNLIEDVLLFLTKTKFNTSYDVC